MKGWIKLHRKFLNWEWYTNVNTFKLFLHILLKANREDKKWQGDDILRGQLATGRRVLSIETGLSEQNIRTALENLVSTNDITIKSTRKNSVITITNYDLYQGVENTKNKVTNETTHKLTSELTTTKEEKKIRIIGDESDSILISDFDLENCNLKDERRLPFEWAVKTYQAMKKVYPENKSLDYIPLREFVTPLRKILNVYPVDTYRTIFNYATKHDFWKSKITDLNSLQRNFEKIKNQYNEDTRKGVV